jgi:hypothetical protein
MSPSTPPVGAAVPLVMAFWPPPVGPVGPTLPAAPDGPVIDAPGGPEGPVID